MDIVHSYTAAVRGFHYYKQFWKPVENEELRCFHEKFNLYDKFAIKVVREDDKTVGHLPRELSRVTKYFLDRGASMYVKLSSHHYRRSPLVQGGIEIPCIVYFKMPSTLKNAQLAERYLQLVKDRYTEPKDEKILSSLKRFQNLYKQIK
jgi:hypothetical protein